MRLYWLLIYLLSYAQISFSCETTKILARGLSQEEADRLYEIMGITHNIFTKHNIIYKIEGGSLLGAVRDGGLILWDDDGDFDVLEEDLPKIRLLAQEFAQYGLELIDVPGWGMQVFYADSPELTRTDWNGKKSKKPFLDLIAIKQISLLDWQIEVKKNQEQIKEEEKLQIIILNPKLKYLEHEIENINKRFNIYDKFYILAQDAAFHDYPAYFLTQQEWDSAAELISFGDLMLNSFKEPKDYLDRNYPGWSERIEILMDHDSNEYFAQALTAKRISCGYKKHSDPEKLKRLLSCKN